MSTEEQTLWTGSPSHLINLRSNTGCVLFCGLAVPLFSLLSYLDSAYINTGGVLLFWLAVPLFVMLWKWLVVRATHYELTSERLRIRSGVLNKDTADLELYRIKDYRLEQPLCFRPFAVSNIVLVSSDRSHPSVVIRAVPGAKELLDTLRDRVESLRYSRGVREFS